jgi:hypothetical protein
MTYYLNIRDNHVYNFNYAPQGEYWQQVSQAKGKELEKQQAIDSLKNIFNLMPEEKRVIYCVLRSVSKSGMSRVIDFYTIENDKPQYLSGLISMALSYRKAKNGGLVVGGCGMDMGFHVVYTVASVIYGGDRGGYEIKSEWI